MNQPKSETLATFQAALDELAAKAGEAVLAKARERIKAELELACADQNDDYIAGLAKALELLLLEGT
jgi:hypothetical protein